MAESPGGPPIPPAIASRIEDLTARWNRFSLEPDLRCLRWVLDAEDRQLVEAFVELQNSDGGDVPDLFVVLDTPFEGVGALHRGARGAGKHGHRLADAIRAQLDENAAALAAEGIPTVWQPPAERQGESDQSYFARYSVALRDFHSDVVERLVLVLAPSTIADTDLYTQWLLLLLPLLPESVRILVVDDDADPQVEALAAGDPRRVQSEQLHLDMHGAAQVLSRTPTGDPVADRFRQEFLSLTAASGRGDLATAHRHAELAESIAQRRGWPDMVAAVQLALGSTLMGASDFSGAMSRFKAARLSLRGAGGNTPLTGKLAVQAQVAEAGAALAAGDYNHASASYQAAAELAFSLGDARSSIDAFRMAAHCREVQRDLTGAWEMGWRSVDAGIALDAADRRTSTLSHAGAALWRVTEARRLGELERTRVNRRMTELLGKDWRATGGEVS